MTQHSSILGRLRAMTPHRYVDMTSALHVAEVQAHQLVRARESHGLELWEDLLRSHARIQIICDTLPVSGTSHWNGSHWLIVLNRAEPLVRQRFTLLHELKHIIDHGTSHYLYTGTRTHSAAQQAEAAADYFAGCALIPRSHLKAAYAHGIQRPADLAEHFGVSLGAVYVRLQQTGIADPGSRDGTGSIAAAIHPDPSSEGALDAQLDDKQRTGEPS